MFVTFLQKLRVRGSVVRHANLRPNGVRLLEPSCSLHQNGIPRSVAELNKQS